MTNGRSRKTPPREKSATMRFASAFLSSPFRTARTTRAMPVNRALRWAMVSPVPGPMRNSSLESRRNLACAGESLEGGRCLTSEDRLQSGAEGDGDQHERPEALLSPREMIHDRDRQPAGVEAHARLPRANPPRLPGPERGPAYLNPRVPLPNCTVSPSVRLMTGYPLRDSVL